MTTRFIDNHAIIIAYLNMVKYTKREGDKCRRVENVRERNQPMEREHLYSFFVIESELKQYVISIRAILIESCGLWSAECN